MPPRKKVTALVPVETPIISEVLGPEPPRSQNLREMRRQLLIDAGLLRPREKKYATKEERKEAAKQRAKERRSKRKALYLEKGLAKPKMTQADKSAKRKARRSFLKEMAKAHPEIASKYGIDPSRFKF